MSEQKALVTGGAGFIGSKVARRLVEAGWRVTVLDNLGMGQRENVPAGAALVVGDVRDAERVREVARGMDAIFHLAAVVSVRASIENFYEDANVNLMGTLNLLEAAARGDVPRFVYASSMAVYADSPEPRPISETHPTRPISPYGIAKLAGEQYVLNLSQQFGFDGVALRYFNTFGPGQSFTPYVGVITIFIRKLLAGEPLTIFGDGEQRRDFVHAEDVAAATVAALGAPGGSVINVGTGKDTSVNEIAALLRERLNPGAPIEHLPAAPGELRYSIADISAARRLLGYAPRHSLRDSMDEVIEWNRRMLAEEFTS